MNNAKEKLRFRIDTMLSDYPKEIRDVIISFGEAMRDLGIRQSEATIEQLRHQLTDLKAENSMLVNFINSPKTPNI